jgi:hypothetical protein
MGVSRWDARAEEITRCVDLDAQDLLLFRVELFLGNHAMLLQLRKLLQFSRIVRYGGCSGGLRLRRLSYLLLCRRLLVSSGLLLCPFFALCDDTTATVAAVATKLGPRRLPMIVSS